jgi:hypothetical protein
MLAVGAPPRDGSIRLETLTAIAGMDVVRWLLRAPDVIRRGTALHSAR